MSSLSFIQDPAFNIRERGLVFSSKVSSVSSFFSKGRDLDKIIFIYGSGDILGERWVYVIIIL